MSRKKSFRLLSTRLFNGEQEVLDIFEKASIKNNPSYIKYILDQSSKFKTVYTYSYKNSSPGKTSRLFTTLKVENPKIGQEIELKAFLIPDKGVIKKTGTSTSKSMIILASHDPNRITVIPRTLELPLPNDTSFKYKLFFQNKGQGLPTMSILG